MPRWILCQPDQQFIALMPTAPPTLAIGAGVSLIHNHQFRASAQKLVAPPIRFDVVGRDDDERVQVKNGLTEAYVALQPRRRARQNQFGLDVELRLQFRLPLLGQLWRAQHRQPVYFAPVEQFPRHQPGLNRLANAHIVGNQQAHRV